MASSREFAAHWRFVCTCCGEVQPEGTVAQYGPDGQIRSVEPDHTPGGEAYESNGDSFNRSRAPIAVMPRGKTAKDRCERCFIVHSPGQEGCY